MRRKQVDLRLGDLAPSKQLGPGPGRPALLGAGETSRPEVGEGASWPACSTAHSPRVVTCVSEAGMGEEWR